MRRYLVASVLVASAFGFSVPSAHAGGFEYTGAGAEALGRAGAVTARADNPMVLAYNPAGLVELRGTQFLFDVNLALFHACVDPIGYYGWGAYGGGLRSSLRDAQGRTLNLDLGNPDASSMLGSPENLYYTQPLDTVCLKQNVVPIPQLAWTMRLSEDLGIGAGLIFPAEQPGGSWGGQNGVITSANGELRPAPTRYMMLSDSNLGVFPNVGIAYRLIKQLRLGAAFEWGIIAINNLSMAGTLGGTSPAGDILAHVKAQDWFVPAFTISAHVVPVDSLDVVLAFRFQDDFHAPGHIDLTTGVFSPTTTPFKNREKITSLDQRMPWKLRAGIRYADRLAPRPAGTGRGEADPASPEVIHDPLQDERWDAELDVEYELNARNDKQVLSYGPGKVVFVPVDPNKNPRSIDFPGDIFPQTIIDKQWQNQVSVRAGGTINLLPGVAGVSAGVHYENRGVNPDYMQIDFFPVQRIGLHGGIILRVAKSIDLLASYAHIFQETIVVGAPPHESGSMITACYNGTTTAGCSTPKGQLASIDKTVGSQAADGTGTQVLNETPTSRDGTARVAQNVTRFTSGQPPYLINAGRYRSGYDVLAVGTTIHF
jgi:hypothetical protein